MKLTFEIFRNFRNQAKAFQFGTDWAFITAFKKFEVPSYFSFQQIQHSKFQKPFQLKFYLPLILLLSGLLAHAEPIELQSPKVPGDASNPLNLFRAGEGISGDSPATFGVSTSAGLGDSSIEACAECSEIRRAQIIDFSKNITYSCNNQSDYVGKAITNSKSDLVRSLANSPLQNTMIKPACTKQAMSKIILPEESFRSSCMSSSSANSVPCVSENYHHLMHNSIDLVARCMKGFYELNGKEYQNGRYSEALQEILGKFTLESNMHINAVSPNSYSGVGQLGGAAISDVNDHLNEHLATPKASNQPESLLTYLHSHAEESCRDLAKIFKNPLHKNSAVCEKISLDQNHPVANLLYSFYYRIIQRKQLSPLFDSSVLKSRFSGEDSESLFEVFQQKMTTWAYNPGAGGIRSIARLALQSVPKGSIKSNADLEKLFKSIFTKFTGQKNIEICKGSNRGNIPNFENGCYLYRVQKKSDELKDSVGGLSCINS